MFRDSPLVTLDRFLLQYAQLAQTLYADGKCARWDLPLDAFAESLRRSAQKRFVGAQPDFAAVEAYLKLLHLEDLALACACAEGKERAWVFFIENFRGDLRRAASAMLRGSGHANDTRAAELADSLYAELYGIRSSADGRRKSLFEYFHGRSKLSTWLRAVLAQKQVDLFRASGKTVSLEPETEDSAPRELTSPAESTSADPDREKFLRRMDRAIATALAALASRERMILACYYIDQLTLAEIGRMLGEHESTISRQLERIRRTLRENVTRELRSESPARNGRPTEPGLDEAQMELAFEYDLEDWPFDLSRALSAADAGPPEKQK